MAHVARASSDNIIALCRDIEMCGCLGLILYLSIESFSYFFKFVYAASCDCRSLDILIC